MNRCENCKKPIKESEKLCWECQWEHAKVGSEKAAPKASDPNDSRFSGMSSLDAANNRTKKTLTTVGIVALGLIVIGAIGNQAALSSRDGDIAQGASGSQQAQETTATNTTQAVYFDQRHIPLFVGRTATSAVELMRDEFDESFDYIRNIDSGEKISPYARRDSDLEKFAGLFVCSQSIAPGSDPRDLAFGNIDLEVSESCSNAEPVFAMGPAAELLGRYVPNGFGGQCASLEYCELEEIDGVIVGFEEDGFRSHKTALVQTGLGTHEIELAMIDLASIWCGVNSESSGDLAKAAIAERDRLLPVGALVRLRGGAYLSDDERIFHRLNQDGTYKDGEPVERSVNELLVATGTWVPSEYTAEHPWERVSYFRDELLEPNWVMLDRSIDSEEESAYRMRIVDAANATFAAPGGPLVACIEEKDKAVAVLIANEEEEEDERRRAAAASKAADDKWASDVEAVWRSVFCANGGTEKYPERCASYDPAKDDLVGVSGGSGGGSNCTWVNSYTRKDGTRVRGHTRCR